MEKNIHYYSTNLNTSPVTFREALLKGLAPDRGLFMPDDIPGITVDEIEAFKEKPYSDIAFAVLSKFLANEIPEKELQRLAKDAYNFDIPLENVYERKYVMRLDQGPTASFKDFAARMMGRLMQYYLKQENRELLILTATSGDTGSAIANAFYGLDNIRVVILFPEKEVTDRQRKQMTTLKKNVQIISIDGKFDDCQALVKQAFSDEELDFLPLSSANSINIGRLLPQMVYYFYAYAKLRNRSNDMAVFSVPSGNFGDLMGGLMAKKMGLPVKKFIVATNENDEVPKYFATGAYQLIVPSKNCISSAMNVGHPSNMARLVALYDGKMNEKGEVIETPDMEKIHTDMFAIGITDKQTKATIKQAYEQHRLLLEPHGAVGWTALNEYFTQYPYDNNESQLCISLETAHPAKFPKEIEEILNISPQLPDSLKGLEEKQEYFERLDNNYDDFKGFLKKRY